MVFAVDRLALGDAGAWETLARHIDPRHRFERGIVRDRLELRRLRALPPQRHVAMIVGSSRAQAGFRPGLLAEPLPADITFSTIAHGGFTTFEIRSMTDDLLAADPDVVVLVLSEFELNTPLRILSQSSFSSLSAIRDLMRAAGLRFAFEHRRDFYRLLTANLINSYRYRQVLDRAFASRLRKFATGPHLAATREGDARVANALVPRLPFMIVADGVRKPLGRRQRQRLLDEAIALFPATRPSVVTDSFKRIHWMTRGDHATLQQEFIRYTVRRLSAGGAEVILAEAPLHPLSRRIYDTTIRQDFLRFAAALEKDFGVHLLAREDFGAFASGDFTDLVHLGPSGGRRMTRELLSAIEQTFDRRHES